MRSKGKTVVAALVAVFALGALASASASAALPEFVHGEGESWPIKFEGTTSKLESGEASFAMVSGTVPSCEQVKFKGEVTASKTVSLTSEMTKCEGPGSAEAKPCTSEGAPTGVIRLTGTGSLAFIRGSSGIKQAGVVLPVGEVKITCANEISTTKLTLRHSVAFPITPVNTKTTKYELSIRQQGVGVQEFREYETETGQWKSVPRLEMVSNGKAEYASWNVKENAKLTASKNLTIGA